MMSPAQSEVQLAADSSVDKGCVELTFESRHENPQIAIDSGVAQIANIGAVISSTFGAINDKFSFLESLVQKSLGVDSIFREEIRYQKREIGSLKLAVDYIIDKLKEVFLILEASGSNDNFPTAAAFAEKKHTQSTSVPAKGEISESSAPLSRFVDVENGNPATLASHFDQQVDTVIGSTGLSPDTLPNIDFVLDSKIALLENVGNVNGKRCVISRPVILNLNLASVSDNKVKGIQHLSIALQNINHSNVDQVTSQSDLISSSWEPLLPDTSRDRHRLLSGVSFNQGRTQSSDNLNEAIHISATFEIENLQVHMHGNDSLRGSGRGTAQTAPTSAMERNRNTGDETVKVGERELETERDMEGKKDRSAMEMEAMKSRIAKLEIDAVLINSDMEAQVRDLSELLNDTQEEVKSALLSSSALQRLQLSLSDILSEINGLKGREAALALSKEAENDSVRDGGSLLELELNYAKKMLRNLREDLDFGLDRYADVHASGSEDQEDFESPFILRIVELADGLDGIISLCQIKESAESTLCSLYGPMDVLSIETEALLEMDRLSAESKGVSLDDVTAAGKSRRVRDSMRKVLEACLPLLDRKVTKITMRRRLTALERTVSSKAGESSSKSAVAELRAIIASKADQTDLLTITSKKVSLGEDERLKDQLMKQIVSIRGFDSSSIAQQRCQGDGDDAADPSDIELLARRFDILFTFHEDLAAQCRSYVPREEVEQALRALLAEIKVMKSNSVTPDTFADSLSTKASATEVQR
jgi:hypothetical protein